MAANLSHLKIYLAGGAANTDPAKSLGAGISATQVKSQSATGLTTITGVTITDAAGNTVGDGTLTFTAVDKSLKWTPPAAAPGSSVIVSTDGDYAIQGASNGGLVFVTVVAASLPSANQTNTITIANLTNKIFDDIAKAESDAGDTEYRKLFIKNTDTTDTMIDTRLWRQTDTPGNDVITLELDPAGTGDGTTTGVGADCAEAAKTITGASWSASVATYTSAAHGYAVGELIKITGVTPSGYNVTAATITAVTTNTFDIALTSNPGAYSSGGSVSRLSEGTAPVGVTFSSNAISEASSLTVGNLAPAVVRAFWVKRAVPAGTTVSVAANAFRLGLRAKI